MISEKIIIENLKCHGCANTIMKSLSKLDGISKVEIGFEDASVNVEYDESVLTRKRITGKLEQIGYPEKGQNNLKSEVISYVSCAIGRISK